MQPALYKRKVDEWKQWVGKRGVVVVSTVINVAPPAQDRFKPYSYVLVSFGEERHEFMGAGHEEFDVGDKVECVLRRSDAIDERGLIGYGIKVKKVR